MLAAFAVTWRIWSHPLVMAPNDGGKVLNADVVVDFWWMRYAATAIAHGHLPALVTTAVNWPQGINMMWNNTMLLPAIVLTPVTLLAGPATSLAILLTAGFAGSAAAMFVVLRRWGVGLAGAGIAGALFGFCPALLVAAEDHYQLQFAVFAPLIIDAALRLATGRARPVRTGIWLGVLISLQYFFGAELLVFTLLAGAVILLIMVIQRPAAIGDNAGPAIGGALVAGAVAGLICGRALWVQLRGPLHEHGTPWHIGRYGNHEANFFVAPFAVLFRSGHYLLYLRSTSQWPVEDYAYLGWPLLIALALVTILFWRDMRIRTAGLSFAMLALISMGGHRAWLFGLSIPGTWLPWHYLVQLPLLGEAVVVRISILADGMAAVVIGLAADRIIAAVRQRQDWRKPALASAALVSLVAIILPLIPRPVPAAAVTQPPTGWTTVIARLHLKSEAPVLVLPFNDANTMGWQAITGTPISIVGGYCIAPTRHGHAAECEDANVWSGQEKAAAMGFGRLQDVPSRGGPSTKIAIEALRQWHPAAVICDNGYTRLSRFLTRMLGPPTIHADGVYGWRLHEKWWRTLPKTHQAKKKQPKKKAAHPHVA